MSNATRISKLEQRSSEKDTLIVIEREGQKFINGEAITNEQYARLTADHQVQLIKVERANIKPATGRLLEVIE